MVVDDEVFFDALFDVGTSTFGVSVFLPVISFNWDLDEVFTLAALDDFDSLILGAEISFLISVASASFLLFVAFLVSLLIGGDMISEFIDTLLFFNTSASDLPATLLELVFFDGKDDFLTHFVCVLELEVSFVRSVSSKTFLFLVVFLTSDFLAGFMRSGLVDTFLAFIVEVV